MVVYPNQTHIIRGKINHIMNISFAKQSLECEPPKTQDRNSIFICPSSWVMMSSLLLFSLWLTSIDDISAIVMAQGNSTIVTEFILLGFTICQDLQYILFLVFLFVYVTSVVGNVGMILIIKIDSHLHTPMYIFLQHLAFVDFCYTSALTPKMLQNFLVSHKSISFSGCLIQLLLYAMFATIDFYLLVAMAIDWYVAICNPLCYPVVMSQRVSIQFIAGSYVMESLNASIRTSFTFSLFFCNSNTISHFFCDVPPLLILSCSRTNINIMLLIVCIGFNLISTLMVVFLSYIYIMAAILRMCSVARRPKASSTCASHLMAIMIFYGTLSYMYLQPSSNESQENDYVALVFYGIIIPMLNPLIYSLRNKEVKEALKVMGKTCLI
ncbi:putative olfactory receptor 5AK3 [Notamacropus eugenii]|uniref:putative olfactory receptor 5AK3 n=1 Tax=Notamacropus eugenii TaxID=9315 RepID=UPI003B673046